MNLYNIVPELQTEEIVLEAVKQNPVAERHIRIVIDF